MYTGPGITLTLDAPLNINITEGNSGEVFSFETCFSAQVDEPLGRFAVFQFNETNLTTVTFGSDFFVDLESSFVTIATPDFAGLLSFCLEVSIIGDDMFEPDEVLDFDLVALSERDAVDLGGADSLRFTIINDDGM